ncbi:MAG: glycosyltransferase [Melioribacteraceae bacterium]|nr:glycosyltransferase [Melioribacteraceae bacterium]
MNDVFDKLLSFSDHLNKKNFQKMVSGLIENSHKILDIGCGIGDYLVYTNAKQDVTAVEPHLPYIEKSKERTPWVKYFNEDALSFFSKVNEQYDLILMIDVVEHLNEDEGFKLIEEAKKHCTGILFAQIPIGAHPQNEDHWNLNGEYWQTHRTDWDENKIINAKFSLYQIWRDWYDWDHKDKDLAVAIWSNYPLVSVVVPSYNQAEWLPKTLDSIIEQTYPLWEAIVVDDGSTDNTWEVIQQYSQKDNRIKGFHKENEGISSALNYGIDKANGNYFCWLSSDDLFNPQKLELQIKTYKNLDESYGLVFGAFDLIDANDNVKELESKKPFYDGLEFPQQLKYDMVDGCTVMIPLTIMRELGGFNTQYKHAQDTEFWFRLAAKGYKFFYIKEKITKRRIHQNQGFTDFNIDCRYDGYYFVDYYLSNYTFRDFYKNLDFNNDEDIEKFVIHFNDMISDPYCHINHLLVNQKFLKWFEDGLKTLEISSRNKILTSLFGLLSSNQSNATAKEYSVFIKKLFEKSKNLKPITFSLRNDFADILKYDRSTENYFSKKIFNFGLDELSKKNYDSALSAFKYLSDFPNLYYEQAIEKFYELVLQQNEHLKFLKSFKRKSHITTFPDKIKFYYWFSKVKLNQNDEEFKLIYNSISDKFFKDKIDSFLNNKIEKLPYQKISRLNYEIIPYDVHYKIEFECTNCKRKNRVKIISDLMTAPNQELILCKSCLELNQFDESVLKNYFESKISKKSLGPVQIKNRKPKITFIMRYTNIIGGGVKVAYHYIQTLYNLGCDVTVYSDNEEPTWIKLPAKFIRVKDHYDISKIDSDVVVVFSVYDVPKLLMKFDPERIYHLCQGYEGYHIGRYYEELRADKFFYTTLHSLPVNNILVSNHLINLFNEKWGRTSYYIPNGIDLKIFKPILKSIKKKNSILFVGNPFDKLKGFNFLLETLDKLQSSSNHFDVLNVYVIWGGSKIGGMNLDKEIKNVKFHFISGLTQDKMAELINEVNLLVSTSWYEGFTLPVLEAMACGVPTIVTKNMGAESFCIHNVNSLLVDFGDHNSFMQYIIDILNNKIDVKNIIKNGFETAIEYSALNSLLKFIENWERILNYKFDEIKKQKLINSTTVDLDKLRKDQQDFLDNYENVIEGSSNLIISIVIPIYNQKKYTLELLESISNNVKIKNEIIIIDNASTDDSTKTIKEKYPYVKIIQNKVNLGFPNAVNQGIIASSGKYILIVNNDIIITNNAIERMLEIAESNTDIGLVGPISNEVSGLQKDNDANYDTIEEMYVYTEKVKEKNKGQVLQFPRIAFLCTLIKKEVIEKIGGLDERFSPGNYEDDDFCLRAQLAGFKTVIAKDVFIHHFGSKSFKANGSAEYQRRLDINRQKFVAKWNVTPEEIWLENKTIKTHQIFYPINKNLFQQYFERTRMHIADNELEFAEETVLKAIENYKEENKVIIKQDELFNIAGNIFLAKVNLQEAQYFFEQELQSNPNSSSACYGLAQIFMNLENYEAAKTMFEWAIKNDESNEKAIDALKIVNEILGFETNHNSLMELKND